MGPSHREELVRWATALADSDREDLRLASSAILQLTQAEEPPGPRTRAKLEEFSGALVRSDRGDVRAAGRAIRALLGELPTPAGEPAHSKRQAASKPVPARPARPRRPLVIPWKRLALVAGSLVVLGGGAVVAARAAAPTLAVTGPPPDAVIGLAELPDLKFEAQVQGAVWMLDGAPVQPVRKPNRFVYRAAKLDDGKHELVITRRGGFFSTARRTFRFTVDTAPPVVELDRPAAVRAGEPLVVHGTLEPGATLIRDGKPVELDGKGRFVLRAASAPKKMILDASDAAGNRSRWRVPDTVAPRRPTEPIRSVHITAYGWANDELRNGVMALVKAGKINAIELDLKDEAGEIGFNPNLKRARSIKATLAIYDLGEAVRELHAQGVRVIGRLVCFRDPILAAAAWTAGRRDEVIQTPSGDRYAGYGGFTNFASPAVRKYNIDVAVAAAKLGVDEILYDYVRRPDGPLDSMVFPGLKGTPEQSIVGFLAESRAALAGTGTLVGASVFGVAATRPTEVAQDIPAMARQVDYIAPMVYPSHWGPGEYDVSDPNGDPYAIVLRSTADFVEQVRGTGSRVVPWLQDFSLGRTYGPDEIRAQIKAARDAGADEFILWDAAVSYTADGLDNTAKMPATGISTEMPKNAPGPVRLPTPVVPPKVVAAARAKPVADPDRPLPGLAPNELGQVPIVMHHMIRPDRVGEYDQTPAEFRAELQYLWDNGYQPVNVGDLVAGTFEVPRGTTPVGMTFDDATTFQISLDARGRVVPSTAVGIMLEFARKHPGFTPAGTFYVNRTPFGSEGAAKRVVSWLTAHGFEIGNHTYDHLPLRPLDPETIRKEMATGAGVIHELLPGYRIRSMALPLGSLPHEPQLVVRGSWRGTSYGPYAVMLVGANPAPSPYSRDFDRAAVPRIRSSQLPWPAESDLAFGDWMRRFEQSPETRYVSDGDPNSIAVRKGDEDLLAPRFAGRAAVFGS